MSWNVGCVLPDPAAGGAALTEQARALEAAGFDWIACWEHVLFNVPMPNAFVTLGHVGAVTERAELLTSVTIAPLYAPMQLAKLATTLDVTCGGRLNLGIGVGGEFPEEFAANGIPKSERGVRTDEALEVLHTLWATEGPVEYQGRFVTVEGELRPQPLRRPPIWVGGRKDASVRRAARFGDVWFPYLVSPKQVHRGRQQLLDELVARGRPEESVGTIAFVFVSVDDDRATARQMAIEHMSTMYGQDMTDLVDSLLVAGTPEQCVDRLEDYALAGAGGIVAALVGPVEGWRDRLGLFNDTVVPKIRQFDPSA